MTAREHAEVEYRQLTRSLHPLRPRLQIRRLKLELFHAIARACDFQDRARVAEERVAELEALATLRPDERDPFIKHLHAELLTSTRDYEQRLSASRRELAELEAHSRELESICHALLATIEHATSAELPPTATDVAEPAAHATA
jgi:phage shock protein A